MLKRISSSLLVMLLILGLGGMAAAKSVTLTFMTWGTPQLEKPITQAQLDAWAKVHPEIKIDWQILPFSNYEPKLKSLFAAKTPPDVFWIATEMGPRSFLKSGVLRDLQPFVDKELQKDKNFFITKYIPGVMDNITEKDHVYFLPFLGDNSVLYYNKDIFAAAGINPPPQHWTSNTDWTWDTFVQMVKKLTKVDGSGRTQVWGFVDFASIINLEALMHQLGDRLIPVGGEKLNLESPAAIKALQFMQDLRLKYKVTPGVEAMATQDGWTRFLSGKVAIGNFWSAHATAFKDAPFKWDLAMLPMEKKRGGVTWHSYMAMAKSTKHPEEAWEFIKFLTGGKGQEIAVGMGFEAPLLELENIETAYQHAVPGDINRKVIIEQAKMSTLRYPIEGAAEIFRAMNNTFIPELLLGKKTPEQIAKEAKAETDKIISKYR